MKRIVRFIIKYIYAAASCLYLFTIGFFFPKNRHLIYNICGHFGYIDKSTQAAPLINHIIPTVGLSKVIPGNVSVQIYEPVERDGNITIIEAIILAKLIQFHKPSRVFEIGTFYGNSTLNIAANCPNGAKVYTLDLPKGKLNSTKLPILLSEEMYINKDIIGSEYLKTDYKNKIIQLYGDSATFDFSPYFNMIDFIFIDGSHSYEYVLNDSRKALKLLKNKQGIILWHDYGIVGWPGVTKALDERYVKQEEFKNAKQINGTSFVYLKLATV